MFAVIIGLSFGGHYTTAAFSVLAAYLIGRRSLTPLGLGYLNSMKSVPAMIVPLLSGIYIDRRRHHRTQVILFFLCILVLSQVLLLVAVSWSSFELALLSQFLGGVGISVVSAAQRTMIASHFMGNAVLSFGALVAVSNLSKTVGKAWSTYMLTSNSPTGFFLSNEISCFLSLLCGLSLQYQRDQFRDSSRLLASKHETYQAIPCMQHDRVAGDENREGLRELHNRDSRRNHVSLQSMISEAAQALRQLPPLYWLYLSVHATYLMIFHLLAGFLPHVLVDHNGNDLQSAGYIASMMPVTTILLAAPLGIIVDRLNAAWNACFISAVTVSVSYSLLIVFKSNPIVPLILISISQVLLPTVTLALLLRPLSDLSLGIALGIVEAVDALTSAIGNSVFGLAYHYTSSYDLGLSFLLALSLLGVILISFAKCKDSDSGNEAGSGESETEIASSCYPQMRNVEVEEAEAAIDDLI